MQEKKRILVAPLDWGIGHATRCIPIINYLLEHNFEVVIAADKRPLHLLSDEFPKLEIIRLEGYNITYPTLLSMSISMALQIPKILMNIKKENNLLKEIIKDYRIDGVISDNRYGLYNNSIPCVFMTHQLNIQSPFLNSYIQKTNYRYISKYNECWILDDKLINLAGVLSSPIVIPKKSKYIGVHSRFKKKSRDSKYQFLAIVSGPESQRKILENGLIKVLKKRNEKSLIVLGKPEINEEREIGSLTIKSHLNAEDLNHAIIESELIICRPGYSTIMDLVKLEKNAFFIPTPGQTEQEYLANYFFKKGMIYMQNQNEFNFEIGIEKCKEFSGFSKVKTTPTNWNELFSLF